MSVSRVAGVVAAPAGALLFAGVVARLAVAGAVLPGSLAGAIDGALAVGLLATLPGPVGLAARQGRSSGPAATVGAGLAVLGTALAAVGTGGPVLVAGAGTGAVAAPGLAAAAVGYLALGVAVVRTGAMPRWVGPLVLVGLGAGAALLAVGGGGLFGLAWVGVGYSLARGDGAVSAY